jgi:ankyrin repeat protein
MSSALQAQNLGQLIKDIEKGNTDSVKKAIESGISANSIGGRFKESLLNLAADNGHLAIVKLLVEHGAEINKVSGVYGGMTPLIRAVQNCNPDIIQFLLENGANPNLTNEGDYYKSPLYFAATKGCIEAVKLLLKNKADINFANGHSVLSGAIVSSSESDMAIMLVEEGANINQMTYGKYPIHYAIEEFPLISNYNAKKHNKWADGFVKLIKLLLDKGSPRDIKTQKGETLQEFVEEKFAETKEPFYQKIAQEILTLINKKIR